METTRAESASGPRRRGLGKALAEVHYRLRTEGETPARKSLAVALGTLIGCVPLYGTHLVLCALLAGAFGLNRLITYLAAHINNPVTAPVLLAVSYKLGHRLLHGVWPSLRPSAVAQAGLWNVGGDLLLGSLVTGIILAPIAGATAWIIGRRTRRSARHERLVDEASRPYLACGARHWEFVRGKLRHDPVYSILHERLAPAAGGTVLDLGCGRGIALSLLAAARRVDGTRAPLVLHGVDRDASVLRVAREALGGAARIEEAELAVYRPPEADVVLLLDVLHYLAADEQAALLTRACRALRPGGLLLVREPDAAAGRRFFATRASERAMAILRGRPGQRFHYRAAGEWQALLRDCGLAVTMAGASRGTPFANVLMEGRAAGAAQERGVGRASRSE